MVNTRNFPARSDQRPTQFMLKSAQSAEEINQRQLFLRQPDVRHHVRG